ncbi:BEACH domain-containing protein [Tieghemostelium lacteum]|uniref:BEACH domain-containing protein n=1 Tax=Tieghemostelium lacteum TaxID=361077 RepID=A0A152A605_TIELA|nr:BEACH domain-containing protein [Tieghemostelium lacteum]|eukprot:KYR01653.1 BEACH domain-containing protein [Tieghemostelium lacteum]
MNNDNKLPIQIESNQIKLLFDQLFLGNNGSGLIKHFNRLNDIVDLLRKDSISSIGRVKILDRLITTFTHSSSNIMNLILYNNNLQNSGSGSISGISNNNNSIDIRKSSTLYINKSLFLLNQLIDSLSNHNDNDQDTILKSLHLIEILGTQHISVHQLKSLFQLFNPHQLKYINTNRVFIENYLPNLLKTIDSMTFRKAPSSTFNFNGINSGLIVDPLGKLSNTGYSICTWINIETFNNAIQDKRVYEPRLYSFLSDKGSGIEAYFEGAHLTIRVNSTLKTQVHLEEGFPRNQWHHLVISHNKKWSLNPMSSLMGDTELKVYIDGKMVHACQIKYPSTNKPLNLCSIATVHSGASVSGSLTPTSSFGTSIFSALSSGGTSNTNSSPGILSKISENSCLKCQMGSFSMINSSLTDQEVQEIFKKGSNYVIKKHKNLLFTFCPKSFHNSVCYGIGSSSNKTDVNQDTINAFSIGDLKIYSTFSLKDSIYLVGGPQVIFPLLRLLAEPASFPNVKFPKLSNILLLLSHLIVNDRYNQEELIKGQGISTLSLLLINIFKSNPQGAFDDDSDAIIMSLDELLQASPSSIIIKLSSHQQQCNANSNNLKLSIYKEIIFNFNIWIYLGKEFQISFLKFLIFKTTVYTQYIRENIRLRTILDLIKYYYNNNNNIQSIQSNRKEIISYLFDLVDIIIKFSINNNDNQKEIIEIQELVQFIQDSSLENDILTESLSILLKYFYVDSPKAFLQSFESSGDVRSLLGLLKRNNDEIQVLVIKIIGKYLGSSLKRYVRSKSTLEDMVLFIGESLKEFAMTELLYRSISELITDDVSRSIHLMPVSPLLDLVGQINSLTTSGYQQSLSIRLNIKAIQILLMLGKKADPPLQQQILNELLLCMKHLPTLRTMLLENEGWQFWLLSLWPQATGSPLWSPPQSPMSLMSAYPMNSDQMNSSPLLSGSQPLSRQIPPLALGDRHFQSGIKEILTGIIKIVLYDCIVKKDGWKSIEDTEAWIFTLLSNGVPLERRIFYECLCHLERELKVVISTNPANQQQQQQLQQDLLILLKNYVNLISIIEDFVFSHTMNILSHRNTQLQWEDFSLVNKLLDIFDLVQPIQYINQSQQQVQPSQPNSPTNSNDGSGSVFELPNSEILLPGSNKSKSTIHSIFRMSICIFQEAESCFYGESNSLEEDDIDDEKELEKLKPITIRVWGLPLISDNLDQIIQKNSIRIQTILASEKDPKEQVRHVMWIISNLITIIRNFKDDTSLLEDINSNNNNNNNLVILKNSKSTIILLLKSLLKTYGDVIDQFILPPGLLSPITEQISKTIGLGTSGNANNNLLFQVHSVLSLNEHHDNNHREFMLYFNDKLLKKVPLLDKLHEIKDLVESVNISSAFTQTRRNKITESLKFTFQKSQELLGFHLEKILTKSISISQKLEFLELQHRTDFESLLLKYQATQELWYRKLFKQLLISSGPWFYMEEGYGQKPIVKLYQLSNGSRMNLLLKRDYNGTDHPDASISYQSSLNTSPINNAKTSQEYSILRKLNQHQSNSNLANTQNLNSSDELNSIINGDELIGFEISEEQQTSTSGIILEEVYESLDWCVLDESQNPSNASGTQQLQQQGTTNFHSNNFMNFMNQKQTGMQNQINSIKQQLKQFNYYSSTHSSNSISTNHSYAGSTVSSLGGTGSNSNIAQNQLFTTYCEIIRPMLTVRSSFSIYQDTIRLVPNVIQEDHGIAEKLLKPSQFDIKKLIGIHHRRYLLLPTALEFFFQDQICLLVNYPKVSIVNQIMKLLSQLYGDSSVIFKQLDNTKGHHDHISPYDGIIKFLNPTTRWKRREISNFEYLMTLNTIAGRTFNDLNQYPVFPWIITDYTSSTLSLEDTSIYRDLTKPIGALNPTRLELFIERMSQCPPDIPAFMYGTHYSSSGSVMFFLMRNEPMTSDFIKLQSGHFDHADRMFDSLIDCWRNCLNSSSDVKELTPEFFYQPSFLINSNRVNFGTKQNGKIMDDVVLPPWAKSPYHFIAIQRMALESEYVSQNLQHWIDLIFGYKQRGQEAIKAYNIFYHLTYEGSVDISSMNDPILREATRVQINNFGVTPSQLFTSAHPARDPPRSTWTRLSVLKKLTPFTMQNLSFSPLSLFYYISPLSSGASNNQNANTQSQFYDKVLIIGELNEFQYYKYLDGGCGLQQPSLSQINSGKDLQNLCILSNAVKSRIGKPFCQVPNQPRMILACGKSDNSLVLLYNDSKLVVGTQRHKGPITCINYDEAQIGCCGQGGVSIDRKLVATGSDDTTVILWQLSTDQYSLTPIHLLRGHDYGITQIQMSIDNDLCLSASKDGTVILHCVSSGKFIRSFKHPSSLPIHNMLLLDDGSFFIYSNSLAPVTCLSGSDNGRISPIKLEDEIQGSTPDGDNYYDKLNIIYRYSINGPLIQTTANDVQPTIVKMIYTKSPGSSFLLTAGGYQIVVRDLLNLEIVHVYDIRDLSCFQNSNRITDLYLSNWNDYDPSSTTATLMVLLESCQLLIYTIDHQGNLKSLSQ